MRPALFLACLIPVTLGGCLAKTVVDVATAPVKIVGKGVDLATTSQSEADENRGRALRKREEKLGKLQHDYGKQTELCIRGDQQACIQARSTYDQIQAVLPTLPVEPER